jgi:hypothetical protein
VILLFSYFSRAPGRTFDCFSSVGCNGTASFLFFVSKETPLGCSSAMTVPTGTFSFLNEEFINDAFIEYLNFDKSFCVSTSAIIAAFPRVAWLFFSFDQCAIFHVCTQTRHFKFNHDELFFLTINVIYLRNSRFLQMIGIGIGTSAPHNRCTGTSKSTLFHYSSRYFSRNTDGTPGFFHNNCRCV